MSWRSLIWSMSRNWCASLCAMACFRLISERRLAHSSSLITLEGKIEISPNLDFVQIGEKLRNLHGDPLPPQLRTQSALDLPSSLVRAGACRIGLAPNRRGRRAPYP